MNIQYAHRSYFHMVVCVHLCVFVRGGIYMNV